MTKRILTDKRRKYLKFRVAEVRRKIKRRAVEYMGGKCVFCDYNKCVDSLHFHHVNPKEKEFQISGKSINFERIKKELKKCILVCANCHAELHAEDKKNNILEQQDYLKSISRYVTNPSTKVNCFNCGKTRMIFNSQIRSKNFCSRGCKVKYFYKEGWPSDDDFLSMAKDLTIPEISIKINKSKSAIYERLSKLKTGNNEPEVVYKNKINWPTDDELMLLVWQKPRTIMAKEFGVSDNAIIKRCKQKKIKMPGRGYWQKIKSIEHSKAHSSISQDIRPST